MGIDRDEDTLLDGVETDTGIFIDASDTGTDPTLVDTDGDGFGDAEEVLMGSDPNDTADPLLTKPLEAVKRRFVPFADTRKSEN
jgi:hypothetical protein